MQKCQADTSNHQTALDCTRCPLSQTRTNVVWCKGSAQASLMIIGEGPGEKEDLKGIPFVGKAGELLDEALQRAGLYPGHVYITNVVKCRPPNNRNPAQKEMNECFPFLQQQLEVIQPQLIVALGKVASEYLLKRPVKITRENGLLDFMEDGTAVLLVYHPAYVLRNQHPKVKDAFFQAIQDARNIAYGSPEIAHDTLPAEGAR